MSKPSKKAKAVKGFVWRIEDSLRINADLLGKALAQEHPNLYRTGQGLIEALPAESKVRLIDSARKLAPTLIDHLDLQVMRNGKIVGDLPSERSLSALLGSEQFLRCFKPVDLVTFFPVYLPDFSVAPVGYHDGGPGRRILYLGPEVRIADSTETWDRLLAVLDCDSEVSRTNILGAALIVLLRHHWPGHKPVILVTANQSHAGKGTVVDAICGRVPKASIRYGDKDWPMESALHKELNRNPDRGFIDLDNVRKDSGGGGSVIRSGFFESLVTSAEVRLNSPTGGSPVSRPNDLVLSINTNEGTVSPDLLNRSLWIHLAPEGDIHQRRSPIGNPKHEYLPQHQPEMAAELHGLIARWRRAGCPLADVYHPMTRWAKTVGGILQAAGYKDLLANYGQAAQQIDPLRRAVAILGAAKPGVPMRPAEWAQLAVDQGLAKTLFANADRDTPAGRERGIGVIFRRYLSVPLAAETATHRLRLTLTKEYRRWDHGQNPYTKYEFTVEESSPLETEGEPPLEEPSRNGQADQLVNLTSSGPQEETAANSHPPTPPTPGTAGRGSSQSRRRRSR